MDDSLGLRIGIVVVTALLSNYYLLNDFLMYIYLSYEVWLIALCNEIHIIGCTSINYQKY